MTEYNSVVMPWSMGNLFRAFVLCVLALHVLVMYALARTWGGEFGFHGPQSALAAVFGLIMLVPLLWAVTVPQWPEIYARSFRARRRWRLGRCPACAYDMQGNACDGESLCPECGTVFDEPEPYRFTTRIFRRFVLINALAWLIGTAGGEAWIIADESAFRREVEVEQVAGEAHYARERRWPGVGQMRWTGGDRISSGARQLP